MALLTPAQIQSFKDDGFLVLRQNEHSLVQYKDLQKWTKEVREMPNIPGTCMPYEEINVKGERQLMRTEKYVDYHDHFRDLLCGEEMLSILKQLSGEDMLLFKDKINYKSPHGNGFQAHLDAPAYDHICKIEHLTANLAVDAATPANGCLEIVVGSHTMSIDLVEGGRIDPAWEAKQEWVEVPLAPGDILFFGSHLAHRSAENNTSQSRASIYATYSGKADGLDLREKYYADRRIEFPPEFERVAGKDYSLGWERYGFAAPFSKAEVELQQSRTARVG